MTFFLLQNYWLIIPIIVFIAYQTMLWSSRDKNVSWTPSMGQQLVSVLIVLSENPVASRAHHHHRPLRLGVAPERTVRAGHPESSGEEFLLGNSPFWSIQKKKKTTNNHHTNTYSPLQRIITLSFRTLGILITWLYTHWSDKSLSLF